MESTITSEVTSQLTEILEKCWQIQEEEKAEVFYEVFGHTSQLNVRIYIPYWQTKTKPDYSDNIFLDKGIRHIEKGKQRLFDFLNTLQ